MFDYSWIGCVFLFFFHHCIWYCQHGALMCPTWLTLQAYCDKSEACEGFPPIIPSTYMQNTQTMSTDCHSDLYCHPVSTSFNHHMSTHSNIPLMQTYICPSAQHVSVCNKYVCFAWRTHHVTLLAHVSYSCSPPVCPSVHRAFHLSHFYSLVSAWVLCDCPR